MKNHAQAEIGAELETAIMTAAQDFGAKIVRLVQQANEQQKEAAGSAYEKFGAFIDGLKGRKEKLNVPIRPDIKQAISERAKAEGKSVSEWIELTFEAALGITRTKQ